METTLPADASATTSVEPVAAKTDGLAAAIAAEGSTAPQTAAAAPKKIGRPVKHGLYSKAAGSDGKNPVKIPRMESGPAASEGNQAPLETAPRVVIPPDLLTRVVKETLTLSENFLTNSIEAQSKKCGLTSEEIDPYLKQAALGEDRKTLVADLAPYVCQEWGIDAQLSPTLAVLLVLTPWAFGSATTYFALASLAKERAKMNGTSEKKNAT